MKKQQSAYDEITAKIISALELGVMPWLKPWSTDEAAKISARLDGMPLNRSSARAYSGINVLLLWAEAAKRDFPGPLQFLTYTQAQELGGHVKRGEEASTVYFVGEAPNRNYVPGENSSQDPTYKFLKRFWVFHWSQCEGINPRETPPRDNRVMSEPEFNAFVSSTHARVNIGGVRACYRHAPMDMIDMPPLGAFVKQTGEEDGPQHYKSTLCHELIHWTGAKHRTGRRVENNSAQEDLTAEIGSAFLCMELGITAQLQHAEYIGHWIKALQNDNKMIVRAASQASKAAQYLLALRDQPLATNRSLVPYKPFPLALAA